VLWRLGPSLWRQARLHKRLRTLPVLARRELAGHPVSVVRDARPLAFCTGLLRPQLYLSSGAVAALGEGELRAVVEHEAHHARRRDPLRLFISGAFARVPGVGALARRHETLTDLEADAAAVRALDGPGPLAAAMLALGDVAPERVDQLRGVGIDVRPPAAWLAGALVVLAAALASTVQHLATHFGA
jgi:Zn-dependent protease with chaperone function